MGPAKGGLVEVIGARPSKRKRSTVRQLRRVSRPPAVKPDMRWRRSCSGDVMVVKSVGLTQGLVLGSARAVGRRTKERRNR